MRRRRTTEAVVAIVPGTPALPGGKRGGGSPGAPRIPGPAGGRAGDACELMEQPLDRLDGPREPGVPVAAQADVGPSASVQLRLAAVEEAAAVVRQVTHRVGHP